MAKFAALSFLVGAEAGGVLAVTWEDCGAKHAKVTDVQPTTIPVGSTTTVVGAGVVDEDVASATFSATVSASGVQLTKCSGDATSDITCKLPLNAGKIVVKAVAFPIKAGNQDIAVDVQTSSLIPASLANVDVHIEASDAAGESLICMDVHTAKQSLASSADVDCSKSACPSQCTCSLSSCTDSVNSCLADASCAASQACALGCACSDQSCMLSCAAASGSPLALPVATCINSNCAGALKSTGGVLAVTWEDCGAKHAKVTDVQPTTIAVGSTTTVIGAGVVDEDVASATFSATVSASGVQLTKCSGDATSDITCKLPLNAGKIVVKAVAFPIKAGNQDIAVDVQTSSLIPASLANVDVHIEAADAAGESLICMDVHTSKQSLASSAAVDCSKSACPSQCTCSLSSCTDSVNSCLADASCAASQACALGCACSDQSCMLSCAAASGSPLALPVATCINSNCAGVMV